jgi:hypothetical protein
MLEPRTVAPQVAQSGDLSVQQIHLEDELLALQKKQDKAAVDIDTARQETHKQLLIRLSR